MRSFVATLLELLAWMLGAIFLFPLVGIVLVWWTRFLFSVLGVESGQ